MRLHAALLLGSVVLGPAAVGRAGEWPQFRGDGSGVVEGVPLPAEWGPGKNIRWKAPVPGVAWSSPVVWGDKVFVTTAVTDNQYKPGPPDKTPPPKGPPGGGPPVEVYRWEVLCLDRGSGKEVWRRPVTTGRPRVPKAPYNTYATETPATDGERVYAYFGMHGVHCYSVTGKPLWKKDLGAFPTKQNYGTASSPVLDGDRLFLQVDNEQKSFLVALDKKSGKELWRADRAEKTNWGSPIVWKNKLRTELVAPGAGRVRSYDPATGKVLWELAGTGGNNTNAPVADADHVYVLQQGAPPGGPGQPGGQGALVAVKAGAAGDVSLRPGETANAGITWSARRGAESDTSPLAYRGHVYVFGRMGVLTCYDAATGKEAYRERVPGVKSVWASPWASDGRVYVLDDAGTAVVLQAGSAFEVLGRNALGETSWATPAAADGAIFLRTVDHLYCIQS